MTVLTDLVESYGLSLDDFTQELRSKLDDRQPGDPRALTDSERSVLTQIGVPPQDLNGLDAQEHREMLTDSAVGLLGEAESMLNTAQVAEALGRSESRIRGAIADGSLLGVRIGRSWRLPAWQIHHGKPLPHLRQLIASIPDEVSVPLVGRVMLSPTEELYLDGQATAPRSWLLAGGDPDRVTLIIASLFRW